MVKPKYDIILMYSEDAEKDVDETVESLGQYSIYRFFLTQVSKNLGNDRFFENLLLSGSDLFFIIFSLEFRNYWENSMLSHLLLKNEKKLSNRLYLFDLGSYIPTELRHKFKVSNHVQNHEFKLSDDIISATTSGSFGKYI